jgi:hypothetical protein
MSIRKAVERLLSEDTFEIWVPGESSDGGSGFEITGLTKSERDILKGEAAKMSDRVIGGFCSTETMDRQDEIVVAKGLDFSEFINFGWFNDNHRQETGAQVGEPILAKLVGGSRWYTKGFLYKDYEPSDRIWNLAQALRKSGSRRKLGFSIEGKVQHREGRKIVRAKVRNVAITGQPVNTECTWDVLAKAFAPLPAVDQFRKALMAGAGYPPVDGGGIFRVQSLEGGRPRRRSKKVKKSLTFPEAVVAIRTRWPHVSRATAERTARLIFAQRGE